MGKKLIKYNFMPPKPWLYGAAIFIGAFLVFILQPMVAKRILPWFGGTASVWATCLVFFQGFMFCGYLTAHYFGTRKKRKTIYLYSFLLIFSVLMLPILPENIWGHSLGINPGIHIFLILSSAIGLPYFVLTMTAPLVQKWISEDFTNINPYRFYSVSNFGSLSALLCYPFLVEPNFSLKSQSILWSFLFLVYIIFIFIILSKRINKYHFKSESKIEFKISIDKKLILNCIKWTFLAAIPSALLVSLTSHLTTNIAPIPILWIMVLAVYLISYILCFEHPRWYNRNVFVLLYPFSIVVLILFGSEQYQFVSISTALPLSILSFFVVSMVCHGELAFRKPFHEQLTLFYVFISLGGFLGGLFSGFMAPLIFSGAHDYIYYLLTASFVPMFIVVNHFGKMRDYGLFRAILLSFSGVSSVFAVFVLYQNYNYMGIGVANMRSFYGSLRVVDEGEGLDRVRTLVDGHITHGAQFIHKSRWNSPTTYYGKGSGVDLAFQMLDDEPRRVAIIGLGAGTVAIYGRPSDTFDFFELNPDVINVAKLHFSFVRNSLSEINIKEGDGRLSILDSTNNSYDLIILDAFTSDAIPIHLLTLEAFEIYYKKLKENGFILVNISNRYLDLEMVLASMAQKFNKNGFVIRNRGNIAEGLAGSRWVILSNNRDIDDMLQKMHGYEILSSNNKTKTIWSDDYSNILSILRWSN